MNHRLDGRRGGLASGVSRSAAARRRAVSLALAIIRAEGPRTMTKVLEALYRQAYNNGRQAQGMQARRDQRGLIEPLHGPSTQESAS